MLIAAGLARVVQAACMETYDYKLAADGILDVDCPLRERTLLMHPMFNKGSAFNDGEREAFGLRGLLPSHISNVEEQSRRIYASLMHKSDPLEQYIGLCALQ